MPSFTGEITALESPIDVMYLMHKVFMKHSLKTEKLAFDVFQGGDLKELKIALDEWLKHILYHVDTEDVFLTDPLKEKTLPDGRMVVKDNVAEHDQIRLDGRDVLNNFSRDIQQESVELSRDLILAVDDQKHEELLDRVEDLQKAIDKVLGKDGLRLRSRRYLYRSVLALKVTEFDHFENEEASVLPLVKEQMSRDQQLECARKLLFQDGVTHPGWIFDFINNGLCHSERILLQDLRKEIDVKS